MKSFGATETRSTRRHQLGLHVLPEAVKKFVGGGTRAQQ